MKDTSKGLGSTQKVMPAWMFKIVFPLMVLFVMATFILGIMIFVTGVKHLFGIGC